jgi:hypothetical protein
MQRLKQIACQLYKKDSLWGKAAEPAPNDALFNGVIADFLALI